jgi:uncharacterized protein YybS (DUF2232 family)
LKTFSILIPSNPFLRMFLILSFFILAAAFVPGVGFIFLIFLPLLIFFYSAVVGKAKTAAAFLIPVLLIFLFSHLWQLNTPYLVILIMGIVGLTISTVALKNSSIEKTIIYPALIIIGAICAFFIYSGWELSLNPWKLVQKFVDQAIEQNINFYAQLPLDKEDISLIKNNKLIFVSVFTSIFPALAVIGSIIIVWINVLMGKDILRKATIILPQLEELSRWSAPEFIIWIFITTGGLLLFPNVSNEQIRFFSLNIFILTCFIYLLQGLAILSFLFQNKKVPVFFRYLFYFLIAVQQFLMIPIIIAGLFDIWIDFRRFFQKNQAAT